MTFTLVRDEKLSETTDYQKNIRPHVLDGSKAIPLFDVSRKVIGWHIDSKNTHTKRQLTDALQYIPAEKPKLRAKLQKIIDSDKNRHMMLDEAKELLIEYIFPFEAHWQVAVSVTLIDAFGEYAFGNYEH